MEYLIKLKKLNKQLDKKLKKIYFKQMFKPLHSHQALDTGSDLWIIPFDLDHFWFKKINWQLGFPFHNPSQKTSADKPILFASSHVFPNKNILCLPIDKKEWVLSCYKYWAELKKPSLRLFLPENLSPDQLDKWSDDDSSYSLSYLKTNSKTSH